MQIRKSANTVAEHLFAAELALDEAIRQAAALAGALPAARIDSGLSAVVAQEAFSGAGRAIAVLTEARAELVRTHGALAEAKDKVGLRNVAISGGMKEDTPPEQLAFAVVGGRRRA